MQKTLAVEGFKLSGIFRNSMEASYFVLNESDLEIRKISNSTDYTAVYGNCVVVRKTAHRNGAKDDTSYYLEAQVWARSSSHINEVVKKIKLMKSQTDVTLERKIKKFVYNYKKYMADLELEAKLDKLLEGI